jgi:trehalose/maltose hydrolase-like predicted phosphorylase
MRGLLCEYDFILPHGTRNRGLECLGKIGLFPKTGGDPNFLAARRFHGQRTTFRCRYSCPRTSDQPTLELGPNFTLHFYQTSDVLQGLYFFEDHFDAATIQENFDFYEPKTVHESSLSPCVHVVLAALIDRMDKAYELYLRTSRLDLDDYNHEADEGLHITSMAGTWLSLVEGIAGVRIHHDGLSINPKIPSSWNVYRFQILYKNQPLRIEVSQQHTTVTNAGNQQLSLDLKGKTYTVEPYESIIS